MRNLHYTVVVRDAKRKLYKDINGNTVVKFMHQSSFYNDIGIIKAICVSLFKDYNAISKRGNKINIEVSYYNTISGTYPSLYAYYDNKTFIKF